MATKRKQFDQPFNSRIPPLFSPGGLLDKTRELGAKVRFMVEMPEDHFNHRYWLNVYNSAMTELALICFLQQRCASYAEMSQLDWLAESGHRLWTADAEAPRCNLNAYIAELERRVQDSRPAIWTEKESRS
jgi:hypothetical protein